jgi:hypothetical protein
MASAPALLPLPPALLPPSLLPLPPALPRAGSGGGVLGGGGGAAIFVQPPLSRAVSGAAAGGAAAGAGAGAAARVAGTGAGAPPPSRSQSGPQQRPQTRETGVAIEQYARDLISTIIHVIPDNETQFDTNYDDQIGIIQFVGLNDTKDLDLLQDSAVSAYNGKEVARMNMYAYYKIMLYVNPSFWLRRSWLYTNKLQENILENWWDNPVDRHNVMLNALLMDMLSKTEGGPPLSNGTVSEKLTRLQQLYQQGKFQI